MSVRNVAELAAPHAMRFLRNLAAILRAKDLDVAGPYEMSEAESDTWQWGIVVNLWPQPPGGDLPHDSLDVWVLLPHFKDEPAPMVDLAVQLATVEGTVIADHGVDEEDMARSTDRAFVEEKLRALGDPELLREVANEVLKYAKDARGKPGALKPKEWSPRWRKPNLGASAAPVYPPIRVNLVERPEWKKRWEPGDEYLSQASDLAWEYFRSIGDFEDLIEDLAGDLFRPKAEAGPKAWTPRGTLNSDDIERIAEGIRSQDPSLESTRQIILDAATSMYEDALGPRDEDIRAALEKTRDLFEEKWRYELDWDLWDPLLETGITAQGILHEMMFPAVHYDRDQGAYDRFVVFDEGLSQAPVELLKLIPPAEHAAAVRAIGGEWKDLATSFMGYFFPVLEKEMADIDVQNRIEWKPNWKAALKSGNLKDIRKELVDYAREARQREGGAA